MKKNVNKKLIAGMTAATLLATPVLASADSLFSDIQSKSWYTTYVTKLVGESYLSGYPDGTFKPNNNISYGEFLSTTVNSCLNGQTLRKKETNEHWAIPAYEFALKNNLIKESDGFDSKLDQPIIREDMAYLIVNAATYQGESLEILPNIENNITDLASISPNRLLQVKQAYSNGILMGNNNQFLPKKNTTRAEASVVMVKLLWKDYRSAVKVNEQPIVFMTKKEVQKAANELLLSCTNMISEIRNIQKDWPAKKLEMVEAYNNIKKDYDILMQSMKDTEESMDYFPEAREELLEGQRQRREFAAISEQLMRNCLMVINAIDGANKDCNPNQLEQQLIDQKAVLKTFQTASDLTTLRNINTQLEAMLQKLQVYQKDAEIDAAYYMLEQFGITKESAMVFENSKKLVKKKETIC